VSEFIGRAQPGISIISDIYKATFRTQSASGANAHPGPNAGTIVNSQYPADFGDVHGGIGVVLKFKFLLNTFQFVSMPYILTRNPKHEMRNQKQVLKSNVQMFKTWSNKLVNDFATTLRGLV
jgi:hypothetical protein